MDTFDPRWADAIARIESGGESNPYTAVTPNPNGRRALGKYQVMEENLPEWTQAAFGKPLSTQEFLSDPKAQDALFRQRFGGYVDKYGNPQDAASAWFTGRPQSTGADAHDVLGTTGAGYVAKFNKYLGNTDGPTAIQQAMHTQGSPMAFADDGTGALSTQATIGPGVLLAGSGQTQSAGPERGLMGAAAALAGIYNPAQAQALLNSQKDPADQGYTLHVDPTSGIGLRMSKNGTVTRFQAQPAKPEKDPVETAYGVARVKANSDLNDKIDTDATSSQTQLGNIQQLKTLLSNPDVYQGAGGDSLASIKKLASNIPGLDIKGVEDADVAKSLMNQMTLSMRNFAGGMPGSLSDKDLAFLNNMGASLSNKPEANQQVLDNIAKVHQRVLDVQKKRDAYVATHGRLDDDFRKELSQWSQSNRLFPDAAPPPTASTAPTGNRPPLTSIFK